MRGSLRPLVGLLLTGYGALVLLGVLPHDATWAGAASLAIGVALLAWGVPAVRLARGRTVAALGALAAGGTLAYNLGSGSGLSGPEWAILAYGLALLAAAPFVDRRVGRLPVGTLVAWSFPLLLCPLALWALQGALTAPGAGAAAPLVHVLVVAPTALLLPLAGLDPAVRGNNLILPTSNGSLVLGVGLVCAGLYPMVLFGGIVAVHAWRNGLPPRRIAALLAAGLAGLWLVNLVRLVILARVGVRWGAEALQTTHAHIGWVLFGLFMIAFWAVALRRLDRGDGVAPRSATSPQP